MSKRKEELIEKNKKGITAIFSMLALLFIKILLIKTRFKAVQRLNTFNSYINSFPKTVAIN